MTSTFDTSYYQRLATYRELSDSESVVLRTRLAHLGYYYTGHDLCIICDGCHTKAKIYSDWSRTKEGLRHISGCVFKDVSDDMEDEVQGAQSNILGGLKDVSDDMEDEVQGAQSNMLGGLKLGHTIDTSFTEKKRLQGPSPPEIMVATGGDISCIPNSSIPSLQQVPPLNYHDSLSLPSSNYHDSLSLPSSSQNYTETSSIGNQISSKPCNYTNVDRITFIDFPDLFNSEYLSFSSSKELHKNVFLGRECEKNPGHFAYFHLDSLKLEQIPSKFRCSEMLKLMKLMGDLTVQIVVTTISKKRVKCFTVENQHRCRIGTGFVIEHNSQSKVSIKTDEKSTLTSIKKVMSLWKPKNITYVYIQTSRHVVFDDEEAQNTVVEFFYDCDDRKSVVSLEGKYVLGSVTPGDNQCLLVCECSDSGFIQRLNQLQREFYKLADGLPIKVKKGMLKKLFMVHHPHGGPKVLSYGDFVKIKYKYMYSKESSSNQPVLTKLTNQEHVTLEANLYRKSLYYAADTCSGSCGAPILTFSLQPSSASSLISLQSELWMHSGVETAHKLGASVLKVCTVDDLVQRPDEAVNGHLTVPEDDSDDEASLGKQKVNSPVYKVISSLSHPEYTLHQTRLDSFKEWTYSHILQPENLALAGFYFTGDADCVRCFQCGLGLRSFKPGDDVIAEHQKHRPSCSYLNLLLKDAQDISDRAGGAAADITSQSGDNVMVNLLEIENKERRRQLTCKICFKSEVRDVFLPCGELYACSECSKLLTHCPSCKKPILATVTVYMT